MCNMEYNCVSYVNQVLDRNNIEKVRSENVENEELILRFPTKAMAAEIRNHLVTQKLAVTHARHE